MQGRRVQPPSPGSSIYDISLFFSFCKNTIYLHCMAFDSHLMQPILQVQRSLLYSRLLDSRLHGCWYMHTYRLRPFFDIIQQPSPSGWFLSQPLPDKNASHKAACLLSFLRTSSIPGFQRHGPFNSLLFTRNRRWTLDAGRCCCAQARYQVWSRPDRPDRPDQTRSKPAAAIATNLYTCIPASSLPKTWRRWYITIHTSRLSRDFK